MDVSTINRCKDRLEEQLLKAKESLKGVDSNLKKFISRNVSDVPLRSNFNKNSAPVNDRWKSTREENFNTNARRRPAKVLGDDVENIPVKRRLGPKVLHSSISGPPKRIDDYDDGPTKKPTVSSCVVAKPLVVPSRKDAVSVKTYTETRARDRRMFAGIIGTLQKFRQEETQLKDKEDKKAKVEKKLEEAARKEREKIRLERQKLMDIRKQRESYIKAVENNMKLVKEQEQWEELQQPLYNYIRTETKPVICYLPKVHNDKTSELLTQCQTELKKLIDEKRQNVKEEVDSLISQWQNVDVGELMGNKDPISNRHRNREENHNSKRNHDEADEDDDDDDDDRREIHESNEQEIPTKNISVSNGDWNMNDSSERFSVKEQRNKTKSTSAILVKKEKEDDYDEYGGSAVKPEKNTSEEKTDESEESNENTERVTKNTSRTEDDPMIDENRDDSRKNTIVEREETESNENENNDE